jgi:hypothetical protein
MGVDAASQPFAPPQLFIAEKLAAGRWGELARLLAQEARSGVHRGGVSMAAVQGDASQKRSCAAKQQQHVSGDQKVSAAHERQP